MIGYPFNSHVTFDENEIPVYDRAITSEPLKNLIAKLFTNGVLPNPSNNLQVVSGDAGMTVIVKAGFCIINGGLKLEDEDKTLVVQAADTTHPRIDTVVMRWNDNDDVRACDLYVVEGTPSANPTRPALTRSGSIYELGLADIFITANSTSIDSFRITDTRLDNNRCGYISSISEFDTTTLYNQVQADLDNFQDVEQADFLAWYQEMKDQLSEDAAGNLQLQIDSVNGRYDGLTEDIHAFRVVNQLPESGASGTLYLVTGEEETHYAGNVDDNKKVINDNVVAPDSTFSSLKVDDLLNKKVTSEDGKGLSTNDYSDADKTKVSSAITQLKTVNGYSLVGEGNITITGGNVADYPTYAENEKNLVGEKIQGYLATLDNPIIIGFNTDQHFPKVPSQGENTTREEIAYGMKTLRDLTKKYPFNLVVLGGDTHGSSDGLIATMQESATYAVGVMDGVRCPLAFLVGNHEGGQDNQSITRDQVYKSHMTPSMQNKVITTVDRVNGYMDDPSCKVRFIFLDAFPRLQGNYLTAEINTWLAQMLSSMPNGYKAIIFSHHPIDENLPQVSGRKGWNNPTACHATLQTYKDKIIACFNGHVHNNLTVDQDGVRFVATTCAGVYELNDESTRTHNTVDFTAYDVFVIDTENEIIHAIRYGNGEDREIPYYHEVPPTPPEPRGNILSNVTWTDDTRLNSSGVLVEATGYSTTDFIENVNYGDTLYFADGVLPVEQTSMVLHDDEGNVIGSSVAISPADYTGDSSYSSYSGKLYLGQYKNDGSKVSSTTWVGILRGKGDQGSSSAYSAASEFTFWNSGYIKSCKIGYDGHNANTVKVRFTFPTPLKASLDIRVNEPIDD